MKLIIQKTFLLLTVLILSGKTFAQNWDNYAIVLGEKNWNDKVESKPNDCSTITIRVDGKGNYYPNLYIKDRDLKKSNGNLSSWYLDHPLEYTKLLDKHNIEVKDASIEKLNRAIETNYIHLIDSFSKSKEIVFLIHGYMKQMYKKGGNSLSTKDNDLVEKEMGSDKLFVEVYWDSNYINVFKGVFGKKGFKMMEASAIPNAKRVGIQLRSLISSIKKPNVAILCHSLGSVVANELSFNFTSETNLMDGKQLKVVYLGSAIGYQSFEKSSLRGKGNYELKNCITFNTDDYVLLKDFGKLIKSNATTYGNTSLGCNYDGDIDKLINLYQTKLKNEYEPIIIDMSGERKHHFLYYARHESFSKVIDFLFDE